VVVQVAQGLVVEGMVMVVEVEEAMVQGAGVVLVMGERGEMGLEVMEREG